MAESRLAARLGVFSKDILGKAGEYERLLKLKSQGIKSSDAAIAVVCLDLACSTSTEAFDSEAALKLSGLKKAGYFTLKQTISKLLNLDGPLDVDSLCVQLGCDRVREQAQTFLQNYLKTSSHITDSTHPRFSCMAVYLACKNQKVKVPKSKFLSRSCLKSAQWKTFQEEWKTVVDNCVTKPKTRKKSTISDNILKSIPDIENTQISHSKTQSTHTELEDYETWKEATLKKAYEEIESGIRA